MGHAMRWAMLAATKGTRRNLGLRPNHDPDHTRRAIDPRSGPEGSHLWEQRSSRCAPLPPPRSSGVRPSQAERGAEGPVLVATALSAAIAGFEVCARRSRDPRIVVAARSAAECLQLLFAATLVAAADVGVDAHPRRRTCDRLRWEWLASTATVVDGRPDRRVLSECARILEELVVTDAVHSLGDEIAARLRIASAEANSLGLAVDYELRRELAPVVG